MFAGAVKTGRFQVPSAALGKAWPLFDHTFDCTPKPGCALPRAAGCGMIHAIQMVTTAVARRPGVAPFGPPAFFGITDLFLVALLIFDFRTRRRCGAAC